MRTLLHFAHDERRFHLHPLQGTFSLVMSFFLAVLVVLVLVLSAK